MNMKKVTVFLCFALLVIGSASAAFAQYIYSDSEDVYTYLKDGGPITWEHSLLDDGEPVCEFCEGGLSLTLSIVADDVDKSLNPKYPGEFDEVFIYQGEYSEANPTLTSLGLLNQMDWWTHEGYQAGPGNSDPGQLVTTTDFTILVSELGWDLDCTLPLFVRVEVQDLWDVEIETSNLGVDCDVPIPSALLLLGSGIIGLVGLKKRLKNT